MIKFFTVGILLIAVGCNAYSVRESKDKYKGTHSYAMENNYLNFAGSESWARGAGLAARKMELNAVKIVTTTNHNDYSFFVVYEDLDWMFIKPGESMDLLVDGKSYALKTETGSVNSRNMVGNKVYEYAYYDIQRELLREIGESKKTEIRIMGSKSFVESELTEENKQRFLDFYKKY